MKHNLCTLIYLSFIAACAQACSPATEPISDQGQAETAGELSGGEISGGESADVEGGEQSIDVEAPGGEAPGGESSDPSECEPHDDQCPEGQYCQYTDGQLRCIDNGDVEPDPQFHSTPICPEGVCSRGGICHDIHRGETLPEPRCFRTCDPASITSTGVSDCDNRRHTCYQAEDAEGQPLPFAICDY